jgi:peptidoglycan/xylan/chitin deacetylase (PgdA/CDA1 family)
MRLVSPLLKHVVYPGLSRSGYLRRFTSSGPAVVTYHGVLPTGYPLHDLVLHDHLVSADAFIRQMRLLKSRYNVISPEQFLQWAEGELELPSRSVLLTCDDGLRNTLSEMLPILQHFGFPCLFFVTGASSGCVSSMLWFEQLYIWLLHAENEVSICLPSLPSVRIGRRPKQIHSAWVELTKQLSAFDPGSRAQVLEDVRIQISISNDWQSKYSQSRALRNRFFMLNVHELRELQEAGMTIGAHTMSHPMLSQTSEELAFKEIADSKTHLEFALGRPIWALAFPFGNRGTVGVREQALAKRAGFKSAFMSVEEGSIENRFAVPRIHVSLKATLAEVDAHLSGFYRSVRDRFIAPMTA